MATVPISPTESSGTVIEKGRYEPGVHTINNANPYQGVTVTEGHGKYPVIFEPLQNVQTSRSTYKVTSFIDFTPYLEYFQQFERYLEAFRSSISNFENDPVLQEFREHTMQATRNEKGEACRQYPACYPQSLLHQLRSMESRAIAHRRERERCMARYMQACLVLRQFEYILNVTEHVNDNYLRVKAKFLRAIDYVEDINVGEPTPTSPPSRHKRNSETPFDTRVTLEETKYLVKLLTELAEWDPTQNVTHREKRFVPLFASLGAAIGSIVNAGQIKKIKKNIAILQEATLLQDQQIRELARYADLTAARIRLHDTQIYRLQYNLFVVEDGIKEMIDVSNFQVYTSYHVSVAQTILTRLQTGTVSIENNIDKIFEYLRIMSSHRATSAVIPPVALRRLLVKIENRMRSNPRLRLPYDQRAGEIWKYYSVIKITPIVMDKMLVILMTIPVLDKSLELNIYQVHNLPAIPPGQEVAALYQLENRYFAIGKHGMYVTLPTEQSVRTCLQTELAICIIEQALYPVKHITWCVYALFIDDEERIKRDCKYTVTKVSGNRAISLGGYLWAVSSIKQEQLQIRCLEETHVIEIEPPLQIVYLGNGCEGYSPSMFLPAKNEMTTHAQVESRKEYFLQFNYVYTPDRYIGLWWQFRTRLMSDEDAKAFITQVAPLGTMDYSLLQKRPPIINTNYGFSWPVPPATLLIGVVVILLLIAGIALGCYVYRMRKTFSLAAGTIKKVTDKPLSGCRRLFSRMHKRTRPVTSPRTIPRQKTIEDTPEAHAAEIHPVQMTKILREVFQDPQLVHKYAKHLDKKVQVDSFASQEPEIIPDPENPTDTLH